ncbi:MAG TPA: histidine kinase [Humibacter sp.]|jgi:signal transduction histidine kinase|nr:histidine kinase [Humibacter sp.]
MTAYSRSSRLGRTGFGVALNAFGIVVVSTYLITERIAGDFSAWPFPFAVVAMVAWVAVLFVPDVGRLVLLVRFLFFIMVVFGALTAWPTNGLMIVPVVSAILVTTGGLEEPAWLGYLYALIAAGLVAAVPVAVAITGSDGVTVEGILSLEFAVAIAVLGGVNRRQSRARQESAVELAESAASVREEQAKAATLAARQSLARDMHDVLAHSLGGLVIQLDAVEAQLEAGKTDAALARLHDARSMAASGLAEARRAVEALRSPTDAAAPVASADLGASLIDLVDAHERLGGRVEFEQVGSPRDVPDALATALRRALQESLSNARKHAPGEPVTVRITWEDQRVELRVSNPMPKVEAAGGLAASGSGRGLAGMSERFAELPGGEVEARRDGGEFTVRAGAAVGSANE